MILLSATLPRPRACGQTGQPLVFACHPHLISRCRWQAKHPHLWGPSPLRCDTPSLSCRPQRWLSPRWGLSCTWTRGPSSSAFSLVACSWMLPWCVRTTPHRRRQGCQLPALGRTDAHLGRAGTARPASLLGREGAGRQLLGQCLQHHLCLAHQNQRLSKLYLILQCGLKPPHSVIFPCSRDACSQKRAVLNGSKCLLQARACLCCVLTFLLAAPRLWGPPLCC